MIFSYWLSLLLSQVARFLSSVGSAIDGSASVGSAMGGGVRATSSGLPTLF